MAMEEGDTLGLSNIYMERLLKDRLSVKSFLGVFSADQIPSSFLPHCNNSNSGGGGSSSNSRNDKKTLSCIVNTAKTSEKGRHFLALLKTKENELIIMDSLCLDLSKSSPQLWLCFKSSGRKIINLYSSPIQHDKSVYCGFYAIYHILYIDSDSDKIASPNFSHTDLKSNDTLVLKKIKKLIKARRKL